jgi:Icc-related predicted phosphoesterase
LRKLTNLNEICLPAPPPLTIAATSDIHINKREYSSPFLAKVNKHADILLLAGDISDGNTEDVQRFCNMLQEVHIPTFIVFGNHDCDSGTLNETRALIEKYTDATILDGDYSIVTAKERDIALVGTKGHGGGFAPHRGVMRGEESTKAYMQEEAIEIKKFADATTEAFKNKPSLSIALTHYAPFTETIEGEPRELYLFLGSSLLGDVIEQHPFHLALHGHAHHGSVGIKKAREKTFACNVALPLNQGICLFTFNGYSQPTLTHLPIESKQVANVL